MPVGVVLLDEAPDADSVHLGVHLPLQQCSTDEYGADYEVIVRLPVVMSPISAWSAREWELLLLRIVSLHPRCVCQSLPSFLLPASWIADPVARQPLNVWQIWPRLDARPDRLQHVRS